MLCVIPFNAVGCSRNGTLFDFACKVDDGLALHAEGIVKDRALPQTARTMTACIILIQRVMKENGSSELIISD